MIKSDYKYMCNFFKKSPDLAIGKIENSEALKLNTIETTKDYSIYMLRSGTIATWNWILKKNSNQYKRVNIKFYQK